jgi:hypothetical protein
VSNIDQNLIVSQTDHTGYIFILTVICEVYFKTRGKDREKEVWREIWREREREGERERKRERLVKEKS